MSIKDYVNQGFTIGDITTNTFDEAGARIRIKDFYDLDLIERQRIVNFAGKVDVELLAIENDITVATDDKFKEYYKSSEVDTKFYNKTETDAKLSNYSTKTEVSNTYVPKTLIAGETIKGITNYKDMKKQVNYLSGAVYKETNEFGSSLKNITEGEMYYYNTKPYMAIKTAINASGFIAPDNTNFTDISNKNLNNLIYKELLESETVTYNPSSGIKWEFSRKGKRAVFNIAYNIPGGISWNDFQEIAEYPPNFKPSPEYLSEDTGFVINAVPFVGNERVLLSDKIRAYGVSGKVIYELKGKIEYITE